jgi:hypothetical protein
MGIAPPLPSSPFFSLSSPFLNSVNKFHLLWLFLKHKTHKVLEPRNTAYICTVYITERVKVSSIIPLSVLYSVCGRKKKQKSHIYAHIRSEGKETNKYGGYNKHHDGLQDGSYSVYSLEKCKN